MGIARYIRIIGRGKDGARALDEAQAFDLMSQLLDGGITDLEIGAFAVAMRIKGETVAELAGFLRSVHQRCLHMATGDARPLLMLPSYNGARRLPNLAPLLARLLARDGIAVCMHGPLSDPGRVTSAEIFTALGMPICSDAAQARAAWACAEPAFVPVEALCPSLAALLAVRQAVGLRNPGHTLAKLLAPQPHSLRIVSHTHPEYAALLQQFLMHTGANAMLLRGTEGEAVADARRCPQLQVFVAGEARCDLSSQAQAGSLNTVPDWPAGHDAASTAAYIDDVLAGRKPLPQPIAVQLDSLKRTLLALSAGRPTPAA